MDAQIALQIQKTLCADAARMYRAAEIVESKGISLLPSGVFQVESQSSFGTTYKVNPVYEECTCEDCKKGNACKHLIAWKMFAAVTSAPALDPIAIREAAAKAERAKQKKTEWIEELDI